MKLKSIDQKGWGFSDLLFWAVIGMVSVWLYHQYILHPEGLNPRPSTHSVLEDRK